MKNDNLREEITELLNSKITGLEFDEPSHTYTVDGEKLYSVTTILGQYSSYKFSGVPESIMKSKGNIGTMVHYYAEHKVNNLDFDLDWFLYQYDPLSLWGDEWRDEVLSYAKGVDFFVENNLSDYQVLGTEVKVLDRENMLSGTADLIALNKAGEGCVIDYKTSSQIDSWLQPLQLYAYASILNKSLGFDLFTMGAIIKLNKDGTTSVYNYKLSEFKERWELALLNFKVNIMPILK